ncbi:molybdopterin molybdotransferase MoeA [Nocardioides sambongensis]|uniref:molybdopterin molybdotransferase MoeA n=1 Tax=Nocardioides sambongensis TaxID=2589074 RepID=UPI0018C8BDC4|nr:gephyrin-like molybdotransferase Glp [Nocardioides sambongensis]
MASTPALIPVDVHAALVAGLLPDPASLLVEPLAADWTETVRRDDALGRVVAAPVVSPEDLPVFDNSAMDGYAVRAAEIAAADDHTPVTLPVSADIPAGAARGTLAPGSAARIMTGAPVPAGADAVVEVEVTDAGTDTVRIRAAREPGSFIRPAGSDLAAGAEVLDVGTPIGAAQVGALAALGIDRVTVRRRPRVLVCSTGSELHDDPAPGSGKIRDSNSPMLAAAVEQAGCEVVRRRWVADDVPEFLGLVDDTLAAERIDLVITSGGVSAGAYEVVKDALASRGVEFTKVAMQPGMPQGAGSYAGVPVICLPGNPVSTLTSFEVFLRPALRRIAGLPFAERRRVTARLGEDLTSPAGKRQLRRGRLDRDSGVVRPWGPAGSGFLTWFAGADCLIDLPEDLVSVSAGDQVEVWDLWT